MENAYRDVNIAFANELSVLAGQFGVDAGEIIEIANRHPRVNILQPGPGVGGHCIPLDPQFLAWRAKEANFATRFIDLAEEVNSRMPAYTAARLSVQKEQFRDGVREIHLHLEVANAGEYVNLLFAVVPMMFVLPYFNRYFFRVTGRIYLGPMVTCLIFIMILISNTVFYLPL